MATLLRPLLCCAAFAQISTAAESAAWQSRQLLGEFFAEGAAVGDIDGDGHADIAYGPFWFAGPDFAEPRRFTTGEAFSPLVYSDNFFSFIQDLTGDGHADIMVFGFPGKEVRLYVNPGPADLDKPWPMHLLADQLCHEAPTLIDLIPGGQPEIVGSRDGAYGYYAAGQDPTQPWSWHAISPVGRAAKPFGHGMGVGDVNGDGRLDLIERQNWYEQPAQPDAAWPEHRWAVLSYGGGGAQILVDDVDDDGDADLITSLNAHGYGIAWFEQTQPGKFARHDILGESSIQNPRGVAFSQPHGLALADLDGDGRQDFVTGKRWFAHRGRDPGSLQEPVLYWFRNVKTADGIDFQPHLIHADSGVGVGVPVADLNGDGALDVLTASKRGLTIHLQKAPLTTDAAPLWKVPGGRPQDDYGSGLSPQESLARFELPAGFEMDLIAAEPDLTQPIAMCFDARGRIWVVEGHTYPQRAPEGQGKDRIIILEDSDGDGSFETKKTFAENINLASGIEVGFGGVFVGAAPWLLFYPDRDGDDHPDGEPEILLDGWAWQDTHETLNAFTWGPDGWLYGCHGVFTHSNVGKPGCKDEERQPINAGVWRYHPVKRQFEVFAEGSSNPWGVDFDEHGDWFITACVIPHLYHLSQGGRYFRQAGQHFNPYIFDDIKTIADHLHYGDGTFASTNARGGVDRALSARLANDTSAVGGGHAHCGLAIYQADTFPPDCRGTLFFSNLHGHRILREHVERDGSGFIGRHLPDFALSHDHEFIGVGVMQGPDGALYVSDWHDKQTCHHRDVEIWDRSNGRLYRIRHGQAHTTTLDLPDRSDADLVATLADPNAFQARQAQRLLQERTATGSADTPALAAALRAFEAAHATSVPLRLRAFWTRHTCGLLTPADCATALDDPSPYLRGWALQFLGEDRQPLPASLLSRVEKLAAEDPSAITRRYAASLLQRLPLEQRWGIASSLTLHPTDQFDRNLPLLCWYGIEPLVEADSARALALAAATPWPMLREFIARRAAITAEGRAGLMASLAATTQPELYHQRAQQLLLALSQLPPVDQPPGWEEARATGEKLAANRPALTDVLRRLGVRFGDAQDFPHWRARARDTKLPTEARQEAIQLLQAGHDPELGPLARSLMDQRPLLPTLIAALRQDPGPATASALVSRLADLPLKLRTDAVNLLATRPDMARILLEAVDQKQLQPGLISPVLLDQFERFNDPAITRLIEKNWTRGSGDVDLAQLRPAIEQWKNRLNEKVLAQASAARGRQTFALTCGTCHTLFGQGVALGPDLTGSNRADLNYLLENVLAPSAVVGKDYLLQSVTLNDGSVVSGLLRAENPDFLTLALPGGATVEVKKADIQKRQELPQSLMPPGLFEALPFDQVADLVAYLASPVQVPLPGTGGASPQSTVPPPAPGDQRLEAETLPKQQALVSGGTLRPQPMTHFGSGWSGGSQLWWTGAKPGDTLTLTLPQVQPGTHDITLHATTAKDYARAKITLNGEIQEADFFTPQVLPAPPIQFRAVPVSPTEPLKITIEITGANPDAKPSHMIGIDRIEIH
ncbi:MAG: VCBS repeat-containing protein [Verrucomicrobiales bacterium]|nr:VCBS repeat-containing protein [Verrucomicrobiales bacterium]